MLLLITSCSSSEFKSDAQVVKTTNVKVSNNSEVIVNTNLQTINAAQSDDGLEQIAKRLIELHNNKDCKEFFNAFPNTFEKFNQLYGYDDQTGARRLYSKSEHIPYFFSCSEVSNRERLEKVIGIGINGKWDADSIGWFNDLAYDLVKDHPKEAKEILDNLSHEKAASFWYFLFDSPHPTDKQNVRNFELMQFVLGKDSKQSKLLAEQFQKLRDSDDGHGR
jgi:hypothetical protein